MANRTDFSSSSRVDLSTEEDQKTTEIKARDLGIEREEKFEILGSKGQATPENKLQFSSFEDGYEIIKVSDLDRIQIAGFSKQKLLEMCNFCKISYGNNDEKLDSRYKTKAELINEGYSIIPFYYNERNKRYAGFIFTKDKEITIAYRGTKDFDDMITDISAAFTPKFLPEGGKMHSGFYNAFKDSWSSLGRILEDHTKKQGLEIKDFRINCTGHSMGAALATITALYLKKVKSAEHVRVATFGSPRVFDSRGAEIYEKLLGENTIRVTNLSDPIPMFPLGSMGFKHVGEPLKIKTSNFIVNCLATDLHIVEKYYHKTDTYYGCIQDMKPEDFQPDNNVSRYYYLSYVVAVPYYVTTTTLATPYYLFLSAISNTEQRYFEREIELANDRRLMSLKDNKNGPVIHALSNAMGSSKNPLIISIECNINGRGEGLKFNIYDIVSFVNSNYLLNRNNMKLKQLYETEDVPNLISAENHVLGKNAASNLVNELTVPGKTMNEASDERSQHSKSKGQQPQKNAVDKGKNIMDNRNALTKHPISNNYKEGEIHGSDQDTKSIEEKLSKSGNERGVSITTSGQPVNIDDEKKQVSDQPIVQIPLQMESGSEFEGKDDQQDLPSTKSSANGDEHSSSSSSFVKMPESDTANSNGKCVKVSPLPVSGSGSSFEDIKSVPTSGKNSPQATTSDGSDKEAASQPVEPEVSNPQTEENTAPLKTPEKSEGQELASVAQNTETENDILSIQTAPESTEKEQAAEQTPLQVEGKSKFEGKRDSPSPESSASGGNSSLSFVNVSTRDGGVTDSSNGEYIKFEGIVEDTALKDTGSSQDIQAEASRPLSSASFNVSNVSTTEEPAVVIANISVSQQLKTLPFDSEPRGMSVEDGNKKKQTFPTGDTAQMDDNDDYGLSLLFSEDDNKNSQPVPSVPLVIQGNNAKSASRTSDKNDPVPQKTKGSKWPIVAASVLAIAEVALGVAIAIHLEMLAVGIAVGACCLVAAAVMYQYKWPNSFIENSQIEEVHLIRRKDL